MSKSIPLSVPVIKGNEWRYVKECLDTSWVSTAGKFVNKFEESLAKYCKTKYAVATSSGTTALHAALVAYGVGLNDEVIVPDLTFIAPINTVKYCAAFPVFMDCDDFLNIDVEKTKEFIEKRCYYKSGSLINKTTGRKIKAIICVHVFGNPVDIEPLMKIAKKYKLIVIEDATESLGAYYIKGKYKGKLTGSVADCGCLSFNGNKIITSGGGGMIITNNKLLAKTVRYLTTQAKDDDLRYIHNQIGYNYRLTNVAAAIGLAQMEKLDEYINKKRANFLKFAKALSGIKGLSLIGEPAYGFSNFWFYSLLVDKKVYGRSNLELQKALAKLNIQTRPLWYLNHDQKPYKKCQAYKIEKARYYLNRVLNLPCSVNITQDMIEFVAGKIRKLGKK